MRKRDENKNYKYNTVNALKRFSIGVSLPISRAILRDLKSLDLARMPDMWPKAQINQGSTSVRSCGRSSNFFIKNANLELVVLEHLEKIFFFHLEAFKRLFVLDCAFHHILQHRKVKV